jgi:hypothetical protein
MTTLGFMIARRVGAAAAVLGALAGCGGAKSAGAPKESVAPQGFDTPEAAVAALVAAAERFDVPALTHILGSDGAALVSSADRVADRNAAAAFAVEARAQQRIDVDSARTRAVLSVGPGDWPLPIPIVARDGRWSFDAASGREEVLRRRIGRNELDAIEACRGYVEAQREYALTKHDGAIVNQYAQRVVSTPGKQDGLAWRAPDGTWQGPIGEGVARMIAEGHRDRYEPFHGYYFKILKGQGPAAPLGQLDFVVDGAMIGGFALVAAPAEYMVTGVKTFIVSHDGVVYEKDLGEGTLAAFEKMDRYNPDATWTPVPGQ